MSRLAFAAAAALAALPASARAQSPSGPPVGISVSASVGGGGEFGLATGKAGLVEAEVAAGWYSERLGLTAELAGVLARAPDRSVALRPGLRYRVPRSPLRLRLSLDAADARDRDFGWRWLLAGAGLELRLTSLLALGTSLDFGVPLRSGAGVPLILRGGATLRF